eukprot:363049-Chlamydomonas_euryale.AAC.35
MPLYAGIACAQYFRGATVNGERRTAYFDTNFATGKIRITPIKLAPGQVDGSIVVLTVANVANSCDSVATLCENQDGTCKYSTFESSEHQCCPICNTLGMPPPSPPSPSPPLPPSPLPPSPPPS